MGIFLIYFARLVARYQKVEMYPGPRAGVPAMCIVMYSNLSGLHGSLDEIAVTAPRFDIAFCCETSATRLRHAAELRLLGYCEPVFLPRGSRSNRLGMVMYTRSGLTVS